MRNRKGRKRRAKRPRLDLAARSERRDGRDGVVQSKPYDKRLARDLADSNSCSPKDVRERALMGGLEMEAFRAYKAISDRACPHCHGRDDSRSTQEVARIGGKAKTAGSAIENWVNLSAVEFTDQRDEVSAEKAPLRWARKR